jgi:hypothetical protein
MRTILILFAGLLLLAAITILTKLFHEQYPAGQSWGTYTFITLWFLITSFNMWVGVSKAGYTFGEELPIMLLLFAVPAIVAVLLKWKMF